MFNNYKLNIQLDEFGDYISSFETEFIGFMDKFKAIVKEPVFDIYSVESGETHFKKQVIESKLIQVMYK